MTSTRTCRTCTLYFCTAYTTHHTHRTCTCTTLLITVYTTDCSCLVSLLLDAMLTLEYYIFRLNTCIYTFCTILQVVHDMCIAPAVVLADVKPQTVVVMVTAQRKLLIGRDYETSSGVIHSLHPVITPLMHKDKQTSRQTYADIQTDSQTFRHTDRWKHRN